MKGGNCQGLPCTSTILEALRTLNPSPIKVFIDYIGYVLSDPTSLPRVCSEGKGLELFFIVSFNSVLSELLGKLFDISPSLLIIVGIRIISIHI